MDVGGWLRSLGLERYEAAFRENEIDETVLPSLTAEDLKDLGVGIVGHRRKLLDAIAVLRAYASAKAPENLCVPDIAPQRVHALVPRLIGHLEDGGAARGSAGQKARTQRVASK